MSLRVNVLIMMRWFMCTYMLCNALGIWIILKNRFLGRPFTFLIFFKFNFDILNRTTKTQRKPREPILTRHERSLVVGPQKTFLACNLTKFWNFDFGFVIFIKVICFQYSSKIWRRQRAISSQPMFQKIKKNEIGQNWPEKITFEN